MGKALPKKSSLQSLNRLKIEHSTQACQVLEGRIPGDLSPPARTTASVMRASSARLVPAPSSVGRYTRDSLTSATKAAKALPTSCKDLRWDYNPHSLCS